MPIALKFHCLEEIIFYKVRSLTRVERGYDVGYFFFISRLQKYCTITFIWKIVWKMFMWIFCFFCSFSYRGKVIIKGVSNIIEIGYSITLIKSRESAVGILDATFFREMKDLIPFHVFLILFQFFFQNICHNKPVYFSS